MLRLLVYLTYVVLLAVALRVLGQLLRHLFAAPRIHFWFSRSAGPPRQTTRGETARDPVCGMFVSTELSHRLTAGGQTLHFCSRECLERYQKTNG